MIIQSEIMDADFRVVMSKKNRRELGNRKNVVLLQDFTKGSKGMDIPDLHPTNAFPYAIDIIQQGVKTS